MKRIMKTIQLTSIALALLMSATAAIAMQDAFNRGAAEGDKYAMAEVIMVLGSNEPFSSKDHDGNLALHLAAKNGHAGIVQYILSNTNHKKYILTATDATGKTAAELARAYGYEWIAEMLEKEAANLSK